MMLYNTDIPRTSTDNINVNKINHMKLQSSAIVLTLSLVLLIASAAGFTATNDQSYLVIMVTAALGGLAGLVMASEELREQRELNEFKQRLNK